MTLPYKNTNSFPLVSGHCILKLTSFEDPKHKKRDQEKKKNCLTLGPNNERFISQQISSENNT